MAVRYLNATGTQALINEIKSRLARKADLTSLQALQSALDTVAASIPTNVSQLTNDAEYVTALEASDTYATKTSVSELASVVTQNQDAINLLNANDQTPGSVDYKIAQASSAASIPYYDTALPASIIAWLASLPSNTNTAILYIHPSTSNYGFEAGHTYFMIVNKIGSGVDAYWQGIGSSEELIDIDVERTVCVLTVAKPNYIWLNNIGGSEPATISQAEIEALF